MIKKLGNNGTTTIRAAINTSKLMQQLVASLPDKERAGTVEFLEAVMTDMDGLTDKIREAINTAPSPGQTDTSKKAESTTA